MAFKAEALGSRSCRSHSYDILVQLLSEADVLMTFESCGVTEHVHWDYGEGVISVNSYVCMTLNVHFEWISGSTNGELQRFLM